MISNSVRAAVLLLALTISGLPACARGQEPDTRQATASTQPSVGSVPADSVLARASRSRIKGSENAPVTLVEVSDFQCPFCAQFSQQTLTRLDSAYIRTGKVKMLFINFPLPNHAQAWAASEAALCAGAQGQFWPMHDRLFAAQREWSGAADAAERFTGYAAALGLDMAAFRECVANDRVAPILVSDVMQATQGGVNGTPAFLLQAGEEQRSLAGAQPFEEFSRQIDELLAGAGNSAPR